MCLLVACCYPSRLVKSFFLLWGLAGLLSHRLGSSWFKKLWSEGMRYTGFFSKMERFPINIEGGENQKRNQPATEKWPLSLIFWCPTGPSADRYWLKPKMKRWGDQSPSPVLRKNRNSLFFSGKNQEKNYIKNSI